MFISRLSLEGYKNAKNESSVAFNRGLNILVGKTAIINALRFILRESESTNAVSEDDLYCSIDRKEKANEVKITADFSDLNDDEKITFLTWCGADFNAHLHLSITENISRRGYFKRRYWGGNASASIFEEDTFDRVECIYLPPLRDAENRLTNGKKSRLAMFLSKQYGDNTDSLVDSVRKFNNDITQNKGGDYKEIDNAKVNINKRIKESLGKEFGQCINLQFSDITFWKIVENIKMVFFPGLGEMDITKFRDLAMNSLGYNNLLYIATVLAELELIKSKDMYTLLLIEEPEAHLHPQLQVKFIKYLELLSEDLPNAQIIVSTHSPVLTSSVSIDKIIHVSQNQAYINTINLGQKKFGDSISEKYLNRWLDITKSTMFFSRGIIMVEGIAEALLIPRLAVSVLKQYNQKAIGKKGRELGNTIDEIGISVININGINFKHFLKLFCNFDSSEGPNIPIYCAGLSDLDPGKEIFPVEGDIVAGKNPVLEYVDDVNISQYARLYISPMKTFEYDMATLNPDVMAKTLKLLWPTAEGEVSDKLQRIVDRRNKYENDLNSLRDDARYIYEHIDSPQVGKGLYAHTLADAINDEFVVPDYIAKAIMWACGGIAKND